jgi:hypothetical protein
MEHDDPRFACGRCALADGGDGDGDADAEAPSSVSMECIEAEKERVLTGIYH